MAPNGGLKPSRYIVGLTPRHLPTAGVFNQHFEASIQVFLPILRDFDAKRFLRVSENLLGVIY